MKRFRAMLLVGFSLVFSLPIGLIGHAYADPTDLLCYQQDGEFYGTTTQGCDLGIDTKVVVGEGGYSDADTADDAVSAVIGDTIHWTITVSDLSDQGSNPFGIVTVKNVLPDNVSLLDATTTSGEFNSDTGNWVFTVEDGMPVVLTLTAKAISAGSFQDVATFTDYLPDNCDGPCQDPPYFDANGVNNSNGAYVKIAGLLVLRPAVTTTSSTAASAVPSAPNTGFGVHQVNIAQEILIYGSATAGLLAVAYGIRRNLHSN